MLVTDLLEESYFGITELYFSVPVGHNCGLQGFLFSAEFILISSLAVVRFPVSHREIRCSTYVAVVLGMCQVLTRIPPTEIPAASTTSRSYLLSDIATIPGVAKPCASVDKENVQRNSS